MRSISSNHGRHRNLLLLLLIGGAFLVSATLGAMLNQPGSSGEQVAEAASRVNRQVDDTQDAFTDIKELIPAKQGQTDDPRVNSGHQMENGTSPLPASSLSINESTDGYAGNRGGVADNDENGDAAGQDTVIISATLTFNQKARAIQGDKDLTQYQEDMQRIADKWAPRFASAKREHKELIARIDATRDIWSEYRQEQSDLIGKQNDPKFREIMATSLVEDIATFKKWHHKASEVEQRSIVALSKIEDMDTFITFYKNQADFKAIVQYDDLDVPMQVGRLLKSLEAFEMETAGLAEAMSRN